MKFKITFGKKHRKGLAILMKGLITGFILFVFYKLLILIYGIFIPLLQVVFQLLRNKVLSKKLNSKRQSTTEENKLEKNGESKKFCDKPLGLVTKVIKISRGGNLVPLSELERQQAVKIVSPIPAFLKLETHTLGLKMLEIEYQESHNKGKVSRLKLKFKKLISLQASHIIYKVILILLGTLLFLDA